MILFPKVRTLLLAALALAALAVPAARAQIGVYGFLNATHVNNPASTQSTTYGGTNTSYTATGGGGGLYYNFLGIGPIKLGLDARGSAASQAKLGLVGVRLAIHPPILPFRPYVEGLVGYSSTQNIYSNTSKDFAYEVVGGLDYALLPHIDARAEIGGGAIANGITTASTGTRTLFTGSIGAVFRF